MRSAISDETIGARLWSDTKAQVLGLARQAGPGANQKELTPEEARLLFMTEADGWTPEQELALLAAGKSREEVGLLKFPHRQKMAERGERYFDKYAQAKYLADLARQTDPFWRPSVRPLAEPAMTVAPEPVQQPAGTEPAPLPLGG